MLPGQVEFISVGNGTTVWGRSGVSNRSGVLCRRGRPLARGWNAPVVRSAFGSRASALRCAVGLKIAGLPERYSTAAASEEAEGS